MGPLYSGTITADNSFKQMRLFPKNNLFLEARQFNTFFPNLGDTV